MSKQSQHCGPEKNVINVPDRKQCMLPQLSLSSLWKKITQYTVDVICCLLKGQVNKAA